MTKSPQERTLSIKAKTAGNHYREVVLHTEYSSPSGKASVIVINENKDQQYTILKPTTYPHQCILELVRYRPVDGVALEGERAKVS